MSEPIDKITLRAAMRKLRGRYPEEERRDAARKLAEAAPAILGELRRQSPALATLPPAETPIALYAALPGEMDCLPLLKSLSEQGFPTVLPIARERATPLKFRLWRPGDPLVSGRYGLSEPNSEALELTPKIVLAPLLGFDLRGRRLGFGGGYYDATLACLRARGPILAGGLAFAFQKTDMIPLEPHDAKLDFVITEEGLIDFSAEF